MVSRPYSSSSCLGIHLRVVFFLSTPFSPIHFGMETNESAPLQHPAERSLFLALQRMNCPTLLTNYEVVRERVLVESAKRELSACALSAHLRSLSLSPPPVRGAQVVESRKKKQKKARGCSSTTAASRSASTTRRSSYFLTFKERKREDAACFCACEHNSSLCEKTMPEEVLCSTRKRVRERVCPADDRRGSLACARLDNPSIPTREKRASSSALWSSSPMRHARA